MNQMKGKMHKPQYGAWPWLWLSAMVIILDQLSKYIISSHWALNQPFLPFIKLVLAYNPGAAFSFLAGASGWQRWFFVLLALAVSIAVIIWLRYLPGRQFRWRAAALALVLGGALGNVIDRLRHGYVIDFIQVQVHYQDWYFPAFNLADSAIVVSAFMLILEGLFFRHDIRGESSGVK